MKMDTRINTLQKQLKWFKDEALNLSRIVENKNKQIKDIQGEYALIQNEISLLTEALKKQKKNNRIKQSALETQTKLSLELIGFIKKNSKKFFKHESIKDKVLEIERKIAEHNDVEVQQEESYRSPILQEKDGKSMARVLSPVIKTTYETPIDSGNIFHQTQIEVDDQTNKVRIDSFLATLFENQRHTLEMNETVRAIEEFFNS